MIESEEIKKRPKKVLTATAQLNILIKTWATKDDIYSLKPTSINDSRTTFNKIVERIEKELGKTCPKGLVPMSEVINELGIDLGYLKKIAKIEREVVYES